MSRATVPIFVLLILASCCATQTQAINEPTEIKIIRSANTAPTVTDTVIEVMDGPCPEDMVQITGNYCTNLEEVCLNWLDKPVCVKKNPETKKCLELRLPMRCAEFKSPTVCKGNTKHMNFCIDKYEYPNQLGVKPKLQNTWFQAKSLCEAQNKRLCVDNEWTQACRGTENQPYPYGYKRDATACRIDLPWQDPATHTFEELDKTVPAGSMPACVSTYGVYDMTGNGDEWAVSSGGTPFISVLKGGHPHSVRNRCSPLTDAHGPDFSYYDTGFRCCKDIK
jgi:hypothetical protein